MSPDFKPIRVPIRVASLQSGAIGETTNLGKRHRCRQPYGHLWKRDGRMQVRKGLPVPVMIEEQRLAQGVGFGQIAVLGRSIAKPSILVVGQISCKR